MCASLQASSPRPGTGAKPRWNVRWSGRKRRPRKTCHWTGCWSPRTAGRRRAPSPPRPSPRAWRTEGVRRAASGSGRGSRRRSACVRAAARRGGRPGRPGRPGTPAPRLAGRAAGTPGCPTPGGRATWVGDAGGRASAAGRSPWSEAGARGAERGRSPEPGGPSACRRGSASPSARRGWRRGTPTWEHRGDGERAAGPSVDEGRDGGEHRGREGREGEL